MNTQQRGHVAQLKVEQRALEKGCLVSRPTHDCRYDLVLDEGGKLYRVQIKYANGFSANASGSVVIDLRKPHKNKVLIYSRDQIDLMLVYIPAIDKIVRLLPEHFHNRPQFTIRIAPTANNQASKINFAQDFLW